MSAKLHLTGGYPSTYKGGGKTYSICSKEWCCYPSPFDVPRSAYRRNVGCGITVFWGTYKGCAYLWMHGYCSLLFIQRRNICAWQDEQLTYVMMFIFFKYWSPHWYKYNSRIHRIIKVFSIEVGGFVNVHCLRFINVHCFRFEQDERSRWYCAFPDSMSIGGEWWKERTFGSLVESRSL